MRNFVQVCQLVVLACGLGGQGPRGFDLGGHLGPTVPPLGSVKVIFSHSDHPGLKMRDQEHDLLFQNTSSWGLMAVPGLGETQPQALPGDHTHCRVKKVHKSNTEPCQWPSAMISSSQDLVLGPLGGFMLS